MDPYINHMISRLHGLNIYDLIRVSEHIQADMSQKFPSSCDIQSMYLHLHGRALKVA